MLAVGKHLGLMRQVGAAGIDQIDARQPVLPRDLLGAQVLLHGKRIIGAALDGGIVGDDHAFAPFDAADAGDQAGGMNGVVVHAVGGERRQFEKWRARIDQRHHAVARQKLAARDMALARLGGAAARGLRAPLVQVGDQRLAWPPHWRGTRPHSVSMVEAIRAHRAIPQFVFRRPRDSQLERNLMEHHTVATRGNAALFGPELQPATARFRQ